MRALSGFILAALVVSASACGEKGNSATVATTPAASTTPPVVAAQPGLRFEPASLDACDTQTLVKVRWDVAAKTVNVYTIREDGKAAMFARSVKPVGMRRTGHWIRAGREFVVRDATTGAELARAAVGTLPCPSATDTVAR
jgi:hypothetical protein